MPKRTLKQIVWPMGGIDRKFAVQAQPPFTTSSAENVRAEGALEGRERGGSRPGLVREIAADFAVVPDRTYLQSINSVKFLPQITDPVPNIEFERFMGSTLPDLIWPSGILDWAPNVVPGRLVPSWTGWSGKGNQLEQRNVSSQVVYLQAIQSGFIDFNSEVWLGLEIALLNNLDIDQQVDFHFLLHCRGVEQPGIDLKLTFIGVGPEGTLHRIQGGEVTVRTAGGVRTHSIPGALLQPRMWIRVEWRPGRLRLVSGLSIFQTIEAGFLWFEATGPEVDPSPLGQQVGYGIATGVQSGNAAIDTVGHKFFLGATRATAFQERLVVVSGGAMTVTTASGEVFPSGVAQLDTQALFQSVSRSDRVYVANYDPSTPINQPPLYYFDASEMKNLEWTPRDPLHPIPRGNPILAMYQDRMVLAAAKINPHLWFMSRQGDPDDYDFDSPVDGHAIAGQNSEAGVLGDPITAVMPLGDDYLLFAADQSLHVIAGDPGFGGRIENVSRQIGVVGRFAWTYGPNSELIFLSRDGLYELPPGVGPVPRSLSREKLPDVFLELGLNPNIQMIFNLDLRGVHIYIVHPTKSEVWWFDWETRGFWFDTIASDHAPNSTYNFQGRALIGGRGGRLLSYRIGAPDDDGVSFPTAIAIGPIQLGVPGELDGLLNEISATLGAASGDVEWSVHVGDTAEAAFAAEAFESGVWTAGLNLRNRPRARGQVAYLKLKGSDRSRWAFEGIAMRTEVLGVLRLA